jgi:hypothetical protein
MGKKNDYDIVLDNKWVSDSTMTDFLYNRSDRISPEEFRDLMEKEYEKVKNDPLYFFKNYFRTKWSEDNERPNGEPLDMD